MRPGKGEVDEVMIKFEVTQEWDKNSAWQKRDKVYIALRGEAAGYVCPMRTDENAGRWAKRGRDWPAPSWDAQCLLDRHPNQADSGVEADLVWVNNDSMRVFLER
jgi:hypothetical protein